MAWHHIKQPLSALALILMVGMSVTAVYALSQGTKFLSVQSGSMVPAYSKGDLVVVNRVPDNAYKVGDVITFINPADSKQTITHRVVGIPTAGGKSIGRFETKGDANAASDGSIASNDIVGKVSAGIPVLGFIFDFVRQPLGLVLLIYVPALSIIVSEMRRLMKHYKDQEPYVAIGYDPDKAGSITITAKPSSNTKRAAMASAVAMIAAVGIVAPVAHAALMSTATLSNTSLSTFVPAGYPVIHKIVFNNNTGSTGSNSTTTSTSNVTVINNNPQTATSGNASSSGGSATSGNATNTSNTNISINVGNGSNTPPTATGNQTVIIYNPTVQTINLAGWKLIDNGTTQTIASGSVAAKSYFTYTWPVTNGLSRTNDRLSLRNPSATTIDGLSWGSDTSVLNPPISTSIATTSLTRKAPALDTNKASDWRVTP